MSSNREDGPVYYREIQKNAYLKRIPNEVSGGKLRPLSNKKVPLKPMWTQFCIHNGRTPYLEQYPDAESPATLCHAPIWRACLKTARHVTASVKPHIGQQYDFLVDTDAGAVRMLARDWESMQDWVTTLRNALHELKIMGKGENVYCSAPAAPPPRAAARDPTSPLPPTPPVQIQPVPGIELTPARTNQPETRQEPTLQPEPTTRLEPTPRYNETTTDTNIENSRIEANSQVIDTSSRAIDANSRLTDPNARFTDTNVRSPEPISQEILENGIENIDISNWDVPFSSLPSTSNFKSDKNRSVAKICGQNICLDDSLFKRPSVSDSEDEFAEIDRNGENAEFKQTVVVSNDEKVNSNDNSNKPVTNVTVIQVSNKEPPHTAIPVIGPETDVFDFEFKQNFVNIVNTEENEYGTTFSKESDYGHISLTTTVNLGGETNQTTFETKRPTYESKRPTFETEILNSNNTNNSEELYERLCMASTSKPSPLPVKKLKNTEKTRKSSLPNLEVGDSTYEYLFLGNNNNSNTLSNTEVQNNISNVRNDPATVQNVPTTVRNDPILPRNDPNVSRNVSTARNDPILPRHDPNSLQNDQNLPRNDPNSPRNGPNSIRNDPTSHRSEVNCNGVRNPVQGIGSDPISRLRSIERSRSQNEYDSRSRDNSRRIQNNQKTEIKNELPEANQSKPIWKRGLTEFSLLSITRLRSMKQNKKRESPTRNGNDGQDRAVTSPVKVVHRSRTENRDPSRRRNSSLSNGQSPPITSLTPLRARQAATLKAEQRRGAALVASVVLRDPPVFADYDNQVWVACWGGGGGRVSGRVGDRVAAVRRRTVATAAHARQLYHAGRTNMVDILFHRVPLGKIFVFNKRDQENLGIKLDNECNIISVCSTSPCGCASFPPPGHWALTEVNNTPINLIKGGEDDMNRLSRHGTEVSILIQPSALVKQLRLALKANKSLLGLR